MDDNREEKLDREISELGTQLKAALAADDLDAARPVIKKIADIYPFHSKVVEDHYVEIAVGQWGALAGDFVRRVWQNARIRAKELTKPEPESVPVVAPAPAPAPGQPGIHGTLRRRPLMIEAKAKEIASEPIPATEPAKPAAVPAVAPARAPVQFQHSATPNGIKPSLENALTAIDQLGAICRYDVFHDRLIINGEGISEADLENNVLKVRQLSLQRFSFDPGPKFVEHAIKIRCLDNQFDPVRQYLDELIWDGRPRIDTWLSVYCRADDTPLNRAIGRKLLLACVRRVRDPGCKFDYITVLEGAQGILKSTMLETLAGAENFSDAEILGTDKREQQEAIQGVWIYEIGELQGMRYTDVNKIKLFASKKVDRARPAYGTHRIDRPRGAIFVATTNDFTYLRDVTGNRRFWPVRVGKIDITAITLDRDQLWAEAAHYESRGESLVIPPEVWPAAEAAQNARMEIDPWLDILDARLSLLCENDKPIPDCFMRAPLKDGGFEWRVASNYLLIAVLKIDPEHLNTIHGQHLTQVMRQLGWEHPAQVIRINKPCRAYTKKVSEDEDESGAE